MQHKTKTLMKWSWVHNSKPENNCETKTAGWPLVVANANQFWVQVCPSHMDPVHLPKDLATQHWLCIRNPRNRFRGFTLSISVTFPRPWLLRDVIRKGHGRINEHLELYIRWGEREEWNNKQIWNIWFPITPAFPLTDAGLFFRGVANISWSSARPKTYPLPHQKQLGGMAAGFCGQGMSCACHVF